MNQFVRPRVVVSRCLGFAACRWNGVTIDDQFVRRLGAHVDFLPVCPEMEIGLGAPRQPIRIVDDGSGLRLLQPASGRDCTAEMTSFCRQFLSTIGQVDGFVLQERSPSCGPWEVKIYSGTQKGASSRKGRGFFGGMVQDLFPRAAVETDGRLRNFALREHFLTKLFTMASFGQVAATGSLGELVRFHSANKLLLMAYNQQRMRELGRIVAQGRELGWPHTVEAYGHGLALALARRARQSNHINALQHAMGYFKRQLGPAEKEYFLELLAKFRAGKAPLGTLLVFMAGWALRYENGYLAGQSYFAPYPEDLLDLGDSGKGRDY